MPIGAPRIIFRSARSISGTIRCSKREARAVEHIKPRLLGHWGTTPGLNFVYVHLNRRHQEARSRHDPRYPARAMAGRGWSANTYLEGSYTERYPDDRAQCPTACTACSANSPGRTACRAMSRRRRPARSMRAASSAIRCAMPMARRSTIPISSSPASSATARPRPARSPPAWHSNKFLNPARDGAVLPILHLNGFKIANPTILARITRRGTESSFCAAMAMSRICRRPRADARCIRRMAATLDAVFARSAHPT